MWESPSYKFQKIEITDDGEENKKEILIDVTGSAPNMTVPGIYLEGVFEVLTKSKTPEETKILDVGAAKLRNTIHLLKEGFNVYSVEFQQLFDRREQAKNNLEQAEKYPNFKKLMFPKDFFRLKEKIDIALLINVINVMPIPEERLVLLSLCREKLKKNGVLLWYNWRDIASNPHLYTDKTKINDGYFKGKGWTKKTFHGEWKKEHVIEMLISSGFSRNTVLKLSNYGNNQAFVFSPDQPILIYKYLELEKIKKGGKSRDENTIIKEVSSLNFPELYSSELKTLKSGSDDASEFHRVSARLLSTIFDYQLKNPIIEKEINEGRGRIDIRFQNKNEPGFFKNLKELRDIKCPTIPVECKNYSQDPGNPEFDQLSGRLKPNRGMFGILICRKIENKEKTIDHCKDKIPKNEFIIVLEDSDMKKLVNIKVEEGNEAIDDYLEIKIDEIVD